MNALRLAAVGLLALGLTSVARAEEKKDDNKAKIVGTWTFVKSHDAAPPVGSTVSFTKDGKMKVMAKRDDKDQTFEGTYSVEGDVLMFDLKVGDQVRKQKITIKKLTADDMSTADGSGNEVELKRKK
jgi:uncharacterized protein (TIGR03066 family)